MMLHRCGIQCHKDKWAEVLNQRVAKYVGACAEGVMNFAIMGFSPYACLISGSRDDGIHDLCISKMSDIP